MIRSFREHWNIETDVPHAFDNCMNDQGADASRYNMHNIVFASAVIELMLGRTTIRPEHFTIATTYNAQKHRYGEARRIAATNEFWATQSGQPNL